MPCAVNRNGLSIAKVTNTGRISIRDLHKIYDGKIEKEIIIVTDKMNSYVRFLRTNDIELVQLKTGKASNSVGRIIRIYRRNMNMNFQLLPLCTENLEQFKKDMQEAFQKGAASEFEDLDVEILPEVDIGKSLKAKGSTAYKAVVDGQMAGGAIVVIDECTRHNHLDFLYVKYGIQSRGVGQAIWNAIEEKYPNTKVWETCTPYFEKRNIHFYINCCGFSAVEFFNPYHKDPEVPDDMVGGDYFFRFEKIMNYSL